MVEYKSIMEENRSKAYFYYEKPPDNPLPLEWNKNPEENPLIMLFNNPWITTNDLLESGAYNQPYSWEVDSRKWYLLENLKLENGILFPYWWKGTPGEFASQFLEEYQCLNRNSGRVAPHERPYVVLEILLSMSVEGLAVPREPDLGLWD